jgi:hypothetical protein
VDVSEAEFLARLHNPDDFAARELSAAGSPVYDVEDDTPPGLVIREHADGRRQFVRRVRGNDQVIGDL